MQLKGEVSKASEASRRDKIIGHSLDSIFKLELPSDINNIVKQYSEELKFLFIVSKVELVDVLSSRDRVNVKDAGTTLMFKPTLGRALIVNVVTIICK